MQKSVDNYFTPEKTTSGKRNRSLSSPEVIGQVSKRPVGDMEKEIEKLFVKFEKSFLDQINVKLENLASKEDIKMLSNSLDALTVENKLLKSKVDQLEQSNLELKRRIVDFEDRSRRNNVIFKGLQYSAKDNLRDVIKNFCLNYFGNRENLWINRVHPLGPRQDNAPVIAHIPHDEDIQFIMKNAHKLRGTKYFVQRDFSVETRNKRAVLFAIRKEVKNLKPEERISVIYDRLFIRNTRFHWDEVLGLRCGHQDGVEKLMQMLGIDALGVRDKILELKGRNLNKNKEGEDNFVN